MLSLFFAITAIAVQAQEPAVTMTTTTTIGSTFSFYTRTTTDNTPIQVDWGNGTLADYTIGTSFSSVSGTLAGNTIKIYGVGIYYLSLNKKKLTSLDVTNNTALTDLDCSGNQLTTLDVTNNTALTYLTCGGNQLTALDVSKNTSLIILNCNSNQLTTLDVSNNTALKDLDCSSNLLTFSTLPSKQTTWTSYIYSPQNAVKLAQKQYGLTETVDLTSELTVNGNTTDYIWKTKEGTTLNAGTDYNLTNGVTTFLKAQTDSVFCEMTNATFLDLTLTTSAIKVTEPIPNVVMTTAYTVGNIVRFGIKAKNWDTPIMVDWGNGTLVNYTIDPGYMPMAGKLTGNTIKIYGEGISYLGLDLIFLTSLDVTNDTALTYLDCSQNRLTSLDVTNNTALTYLDCSENQITALDLTKNTTLNYLDCNLNQLTALDLTNNTALNYLDCNSNQLNALDVINNTALWTLSCGRNQLTALDVSKNTGLIHLNFDTNQLTALDVTNNTRLRSLSCGRNQLTALDGTNNTALAQLNCFSNKLTFATLPNKQATWDQYLYSPQDAVKLTKTQYDLTETVDLSSELSVNGKTTNYIWKTKGGVTLTAGRDYNVINGITTFLKVQSDSVYCQMTNATFPYLTLNTTNIKVSEHPLSVGDNEIAIKIYPNPATENFTIKMAEEIVRVEVYTITGVKVFDNGLYSSTTVTVPLTSMPKGALLIKAYTRNGVYSGKVVKI